MFEMQAQAHDDAVSCANSAGWISNQRMGFRMRICSVLTPALVALLVAPSALAASYDGTQPFICTPTDIISCTPDAPCQKETAESVNLPPSLTIDVAASQITGTQPNGQKLATTIDNVRHVEDDLALQGVQGHIAWSVTVGKESGEMALAAMGDGTGYIAFGGCSLR
jgi:hypothetical protein